jgi:hypothetical protein
MVYHDLRLKKNKKMNNQIFFEKVAEMRKHQKTYQEARPSSQKSRDALIASKRLETEIDQEIARVQAILAKKDIFLVQYKDVDGSIASSLVEGFDMETQYRQGYIVANITKQIITYNGKDWEVMTLKPGSSMPTTIQAKGGAS